ncbi:carbohydrate-binding protein [Anaerocolumna sp. AGMB13020]|uniref:carbohydrate-binding protein n=1 Tax=Anaerocolumna sp. AGMB13020 TaxID=3081750 RepID=UPI002955AEE2|nr:carbohydrate-binding protein [Anaerocolumna sp. AGMB13020]WOO38235.1 carbohydrate-binding protein [Anaerocolumna sp. AGMB13020]
MSKKFGVVMLVCALIVTLLPGMTVYAASSTIAKSVGNSNPLIDHHLGADPFALTYNGRVYLYMSSDNYEYNSDGTIKENSFANLKSVFVISSEDMVNWTDHGAVPVAGANGANGGQGIAKWAGASWAPAAAVKNINGKDKFFLYFANGAGGIGVLTADSPIGPWSDPLGKALVTTATPGMSGVVWLFDPAVFVDDDGTGYLYCGGGIPGGSNPTQEQRANPKTARVLKLGSDMTSIVGSASTIDAPFMFEDSGIHKYNGTYYYSYCINFSGTHPADKPAGEIGYMTSQSPMGPFTYAGHFLKNPGVFFGAGGNNHHSVFNLNNQWYVAYHAQTVSLALYGAGKGYRSPHINKLVHNGNGSIQEVSANYAGISQLINLNPYNRVEAETIGWNGGILTEKCQAAGGPVSNQNVTSIHSGDWIAVGDADFGAGGAKSFKANIASVTGGQIEIRLDSITGSLVGTLSVPSTGGLQSWREVETTISGATGVHKVFFVFTGSGTGNLFNIDYWQFSQNNPGSSTGTTYEAETGTLLVNAVAETINSGYTGSGYVNFTAYSDASVQWSNIYCAVSGTKNIKFRYALETGTRNLDIYVNGVKVISNAAFNATGSWTSWAEKTIQVTMNSGTNTLKAVTTGTEGPNIDSVNVSAQY